MFEVACGDYGLVRLCLFDGGCWFWWFAGLVISVFGF